MNPNPEKTFFHGGQPVNLTNEQRNTIETLRGRWPWVGEPCPLPADDCVMVQVGSEPGKPYMTIGVEADGYPHS